jgi:hypothetical protein
MIYLYVAMGSLIVIALNILLKYSGTILATALTLVFFILSQVALGWEALGFIILALLSGASLIIGTVITVLTNFFANRK